MKWMIRSGILFTILMAAVLALFYTRFESSRKQGRDIAYYNDCLIRMCEEYEKGISEEKLEQTYDCTIVLAKELVQRELTSYYERGALVLDFSPGGAYLGKVIWDDQTDRDQQFKSELQALSLYFWAGILICGYILIFLVWLFLVRPVTELSGYASRIAKGNLDIPLPMKKRALFGGFIESFDIMREELKAARQREIDAGIAKKEMIAALSHDIKTPIATIRATCEVLQMKCQRRLSLLTQKNDGDATADAADLQDTLEKAASITAKAELIDSLMNNLLHTSLEELDRIEITPREQPSALIEQYFQNLKTAGEGAVVILDNSIPACLVYMDRLRMEQVIDNCVGNSVKYAGTDIHVSFDEASGGYIRIRIHDSGPGVSSEDLPLITEKYYRGKGVSDKTGYGLGMYLVKLYMEKQGGGIEYYNDNGFTVELLLKKV